MRAKNEIHQSGIEMPLFEFNSRCEFGHSNKPDLPEAEQRSVPAVAAGVSHALSYAACPNANSNSMGSVVVAVAVDQCCSPGWTVSGSTSEEN